MFILNMYIYTCNCQCSCIVANAATDMKHDFLQEIAMMKKVASGKNPYVVNMIGCCIRQEPLALVLEYVPTGNLLDYLREMRAAVGISILYYSI